MSGDAYYPNVSLLLHCDGVLSGTTFTDNSPSPKTVTAYNQAHTDTLKSKFGGSSGAFDGTGDYLRIPYSNTLDPGSGDFTIEAWVYATAYRANDVSICGTYTYGSVDGGTNNSGWQLAVTSAGKLKLGWGNNSTFTEIVASTGSIGLDAWVHVAATRSGSTVRLFINGVQDGSATNSSNITVSKSYFYVGSYNRSDTPFSAGISWYGYLEDIRFTKGVARYTADFTPPTAAFPDHAGQIAGVVKDENGDEIAGATVRAHLRSTGALLFSALSGDGSSEITGDPYWQNTVMLLHAEGTDGSTTVTDSSLAARTVSVFGNAHIEADQYKFGSASIAFDGNGDYLSVASHDALNFLLADYTIEFFVRFNVVNATQTIMSRYTGWATAVELYLELMSTGYIRYRAGNNIPISITGTIPITANTWHHIAVTCTGGTTRLFIDGVLDGSTAATASLSSTGALGIGYELAGGVYYLNGYLDEIRITKGVSRYTENFTPPAAAFLGATVPASLLGEYLFSFATLDDIQVIALDPAGGETFNDLLLRVTPA